MHKHTPGPWRVDPRSYAEGARGHVVCNVELAFTTLAVRGEPDHLACPSKVALDEIGHANARLVAAAPELLEALRETLRALEAHLTKEAQEAGVSRYRLCPCMGDEVQRARAAIAKAEG